MKNLESLDETVENVVPNSEENTDPKISEQQTKKAVSSDEDNLAKILAENAAMKKSLDSILDYVLTLEREQKIRLTKLRNLMGNWGL